MSTEAYGSIQNVAITRDGRSAMTMIAVHATAEAARADGADERIIKALADVAYHGNLQQDDASGVVRYLIGMNRDSEDTSIQRPSDALMYAEALIEEDKPATEVRVTTWVRQTIATEDLEIAQDMTRTLLDLGLNTGPQDALSSEGKHMMVPTGRKTKVMSFSGDNSVVRYVFGQKIDHEAVTGSDIS